MKIYAARQPVFEASGKLFGYEFLYRDSGRNEFNYKIDGSMATCFLMSNIISEFGLDNLTGGTYAFLNLTEELLRNDYLHMVDPEHFIVEILEDVRDDAVLRSRLESCREKGYAFALDDFTGRSVKDGLVEVSDILKVDFRLTDKKEQRNIARRYGKSKILLAEKVETEEEREWAVSNGYSLLQGYLFSKPVLLSKEKTEIALATYMRLLREFSGREPDFDSLTDIIKMDVNLSYKFLLRVNTMQYGSKYRINTVKQTLIRMGLLEVRRWTLAILIRDVFGKKDNESAKRALIRGVFTEKLVELMKREEFDEEAYMVGMFSTIDVSVKESLEELLSQVRISREAREALFSRKGDLGEILDFVENYENGKWEEACGFLAEYRLEQAGISVIYFEAVKYAEKMFEDYEDGDAHTAAVCLEQESLLVKMLNQQKAWHEGRAPAE